MHVVTTPTYALCTGAPGVLPHDGVDVTGLGASVNGIIARDSCASHLITLGVQQDSPGLV